MKAHDDAAERYRLASTLLDAATRLISSTDRAEVLQGFCNTLVTATPHVRLAWLWMGEPDAQEVTPMIFAGPAREYAGQLRIQRGWLVQKGPVFQVLSGSEVSEMNISPRSLYRPWRIAATRWGFQRAVVLKFAASTPEQIGLLALYVDEREYFSRVGLEPIRAIARVVESILRQWDMVERLEEQIEIDPLTNIYNRRGWERRLHLELQQCPRRESMVGIGILDLDDLKTVNDQWGHVIGDHLLQEAVWRIQNALREGDAVARLGGDEFGLLLTDLERAADLALIVERILDSLRQPYLIEGQSITTSASLGFTLYPQDEEDQDTLIRHADSALYRAKERGKDQSCFYSPIYAEESTERAITQSRIATALNTEQFCLYYQPIVSLSGESIDTVLGVEALLRLDPGDGQPLLTPAAFFDKLDHPRFARKIGVFALETAVAQWLRWQAKGLRLRVAVNISASYLLDSRFLTDLTDILENYPDFPVDQLEIEITESAPLRNLELAAKVLTSCKEKGIRIALDDFGTGYASLTYIQHLPVDSIKIDQTFVRALFENKKSKAIVGAIISGAAELGMEVIAEGIETPVCVDALQKLGCQYLQGYFIARPMPPNEIFTWAERAAEKNKSFKFLAI